MKITSFSPLLLLGMTGLALPPACAFEESAALPERLPPLAEVRQRALPEDFAALASPAWADARPPLTRQLAELLDASRAGQLDRVKALLADGVPANSADESGQRPLLAAVAAGQGETARLLLQRGASPDVRGPDGRTPLGMAAAAGHLGLVRLLLRAGATVDARGANRSTALHEAVRFDHPEVVRALLAAQPDPQKYDREGLHPLALAAARGRLACLRLMLEQGLAPDMPDHAGLTALFWARRQDQPLAESLLVEHGASREAWPLDVD